MWEKHLSKIAASIADQSCVVFVGAGVSRAFGLPSWDELVSRMAAHAGFDSEVFKCFGNAMGLAEFLRLKGDAYQHFITDIQNDWAEKTVRISDSEIHRLIVELGFPVIYTTNFDNLLEEAHVHHGFRAHTVKTIEDIPTHRDGTLIVKYHGDITEPKTLVMAESDYYNRLELSHPLDLKLRHDLLGKSVLFIGYSMTDFNVRYLFFRLAQLWKNAASCREPSYIFMAEPNEVEDAVLHEWGVTRFSLPGQTDPTTALLNLLRGLRQRVEVDISALRLGKTIAVDFDGVVHRQPDHWKATDVIDGELIAGAIECLSYLKAEGFVINISSARANCPRGKVAMEKWMKEKNVPFDTVSSRAGAKLYIDDLAVRFDGNWSIERVKEWLRTDSWHRHPHSRS